jgi:hypothetical protein
MATRPHDRLAVLRAKIAQQHTTVEALKRGGHDHTDAERQLTQMLENLRISENASRLLWGRLSWRLFSGQIGPGPGTHKST